MFLVHLFSVCLFGSGSVGSVHVLRAAPCLTSSSTILQRFPRRCCCGARSLGPVRRPEPRRPPFFMVCVVGRLDSSQLFVFRLGFAVFTK